MALGINELTLAVIIGTLAAIVYSLRVLVILERRMARMERHVEIMVEHMTAGKRSTSARKPARKLGGRRVQRKTGFAWN